MPPGKSLVNKVSTSWGFLNSFKQLSDIQGRQVGSILGAMVGDAACRPLDRQLDTTLFMLSGSTSKPTADEKEMSLAFSPRWHSTYSGGEGPLRYHSYAGECLNAIIACQVEARGHAVDFSKVTAKVGAISAAYPREAERIADFGFYKDFDPEESDATTLQLKPIPLFPLACCATLATKYPYCDDAPLHQYTGGLLECLTGVTVEEGFAALAAVSTGRHYSVSGHKKGDPYPLGLALSIPYTLSIMSLLMRYLQSNPDPIKNSALRCVPGTSAVYPAEFRRYCPDIAEEAAQSGNPSLSTATADWRRIIEILSVSSSYTEGIELVLQDGGNVCEKAIVVGSGLGAKYQARFLPGEWIDATEDHGVLCSNAIECAQWAWNPIQRQ